MILIHETRLKTIFILHVINLKLMIKFCDDDPLCNFDDYQSFISDSESYKSENLDVNH